MDNEAALSVAPVAFHNRNGESFIAVGTAKGLTFHPRSHEGCFVHVYRFVADTALEGCFVLYLTGFALLANANAVVSQVCTLVTLHDAALSA